MTIDSVLMLHRISAKMMMAATRRMVDDEMPPEESRDALGKRLRSAVRKEDWEGAAACMTMLWCQDWRKHLGRDFAVHGEEPEHAATFPANDKGTPSGEVVIFPRRTAD